MDLQNQQERLNKQGLKDMLTKTIAQATGKSHWEIRSLVDQEKQASVVGQAQVGLEGIDRMEQNMKEMQEALAKMLLEKQKKNELRKQQMASTASQHFDDIPIHYVADGQAVLVRHMMGGKGKGFGKTSGGFPYRAEGDGREFARERETQYHNIATPRPSDDASGERLGDNHHSVRKALVEQAEDKKEAEAVTRTLRGRVGEAFVSLFANRERKSLSPAGEWRARESDKKEMERQLKEEQEEQRRQRKDKKIENNMSVRKRSMTERLPLNSDHLQ